MRLKQAASDAATMPVYDAETVRQVLARAVELEAQVENTSFSAAQIEVLGQRFGIATTVVHEALEQVAGRQRRQHVVKAVIPGLLYGFAIFVLFTLFGVQFMQPFTRPFFEDLQLLSLTYLPPLLVLVVGWHRRDYRLGALAGLVVGVATCTGFALGTTVSAMVHPEQKDVVDLDVTIIYCAVPLMLLGILSGSCGRAWQARLARSNR